MVTTILPSHYPAFESGHDFSPASIGTHASPLESCDGTWAKVQLRLHVPLTLGQLRGEGEACQIISQVLASDDFLKHAMVDQLLPKDHLRALAETRSRLEWLIKEEAIHGLLTWSPIDAPVLRWIDRKLSVRNPFVDFPSSFSMSLKFVDKAAGQELFTRELEHLFIHPYCILRSEDDLSSLSSLLQDSGKRSGLGISVAEASGAEVAAPNFWMLLVPNAEHVQISFFSKSVAGVERSRIIQRIRRKIAQLLRQVNQQVLLDELDASRFCSRYLIPPDASDEAAESASSESDGEFVGESFDDESCSLAKSLSISDFSEDLQLQVGPTKFRSGQFQCPLQFCEVFALHWRIKPQMALDHILASVMHPFSVSNRQNLFVIRDSASVFYLRLKEAKLPAKPDPSDLLEATFEAALPSFNRPNSRYPPFSACSSVVGPNTELRGLVLEVYGMHTPGRGIKEELVSLIEGRLVGHLTLNIISSYLARNATLKLTPADVHFIFPLRQHPKPMATATHPLHYPFLNPVLTMFYIKQNLLQYLHILAAISAARNPDADSCDCFGGDFTFFYNCIASRSPTPIEQQLGQGLGTVCLTLTNPTTGCVMFQHNEDHQLGSKPSAPTPPPLEFVPSDVPTSYRIHIDVWTVGSVEPEALLTQVMASIRQSSCDYLLDCCIQRFVNELSLLGDRRVSHGHSDKDLPEFAFEDGLPNVDVDSSLVRSNVDVDSHLVRPNVNVNSHLLRPIAAIIADGKQLNNPAMLCLQVPCALTSSSQKLLVTQVHDWLGELNAQLNPVIFNGQGEAVGAPRLAAEAFPTCPEDNEPGTYILLSRASELVANHASVKSGKPSAPRKDRPLEDLMLYPPLSYPHQCQKLTGTRLELARRHFIGFVVEGSCVKLYTANLARTFLEQLRGLVERSLAWQRSRTSLLDLILQQKMGLFHQQYEIVGQLLPSPRNSASQSHLRGSLELHRLGLVIRNPSLGRVRTGIDVRAKPFEPQEPIDNISMASANDEACRPEPHRFSQINRVLTYPPDASFTEVSTDTCQIDYLQIHGQGFLDQYRKLLTYSPHELEPAQVSLFQASSPFSDRFASNDPEALALLVQSAHLLADSRSIDGDLLFNESSQDDSFTNWYRLVTERFNQDGVAARPEESPEARLASSPAFYTKRMCGNMIIVSLDIKSMFVRIDIYAMVLGAPSPTAWQGFLKECARLKSITHAHSFVYDFHLLILQEWLDGRLDSIPKVNLISICSALLKSPLTMGNYSCNRLTSGHLVPSSFNARDIYHYIIRSPLRYGVRNIYCDNRPVGFFIAEDLPPSVRRLIILTPSDTPGGPAFLYNDLVVHKDSFQSFPAAPNQSPLGSLTLRSPEAVILAQLDEVLKLHHIDALWKQLQADDAELDVVEIERLTNEFSHLDLIQIEPSFAELTQMGLDWHRALDSLIQIYPKMCRGRIQPRHPSSEQEGRHVLFFNPYDSHHLIHFCLSTAGLHVSAVSRDPRADLKVVECEHVTSILRTLFYSMWQSFHNSPL
ncbi:hypothetical protein L0F63_002965 [Massospora cicadina]|nr:hypothetical protein L0F63_002965 [Massospora cicadina]